VKILVTGCAGFIGSHVTDRLLKKGFDVVGIDNFNDYYDPKIKEENLDQAKKNKHFELYREDILNFEAIKKIFEDEKPTKVVHLAARAGVRSSIADPLLFSHVNVEGTVNLLKLSVDFGIKQFIVGSSSSVYGDSKRLPFCEDDPCDKIISPYGTSKRAAEFWVESFYHTYALKAVILRFFTVYGPRNRPDMAPALFANAIINNKPINRFGNGSSGRDYTYIDDIVEGILKTLDQSMEFEIINLGNSNPVNLLKFISYLEKIINKKAQVKNIPKQSGDVQITWADINKAKKILDWQPKTQIKSGLGKYIQWLKKQI